MPVSGLPSNLIPANTVYCLLQECILLTTKLLGVRREEGRRSKSTLLIKLFTQVDQKRTQITVPALLTSTDHAESGLKAAQKQGHDRPPKCAMGSHRALVALPHGPAQARLLTWLMPPTAACWCWVCSSAPTPFCLLVWLALLLLALY